MAWDLFDWPATVMKPHGSVAVDMRTDHEAIRD
jgi:hypothetical protein